jgi:hypothetical protein
MTLQEAIQTQQAICTPLSNEVLLTLSCSTLRVYLYHQVYGVASLSQVMSALKMARKTVVKARRDLMVANGFHAVALDTTEEVVEEVAQDEDSLSGFPTKPSGFPAKPSGFPAKPSGFPTKPSGFPTKPSGFPATTTEGDVEIPVSSLPSPLSSPLSLPPTPPISIPPIIPPTISPSGSNASARGEGEEFGFEQKPSEEVVVVENPVVEFGMTTTKVASIALPSKKSRKSTPSEVVIPDSLMGQEFAEVWMEWCQHRKELRKPLTSTSVKQQLAKLEEFKANGSDPVEVIKQSISNGWQGLFEVKQQSYRTNGTYQQSYERTAKVGSREWSADPNYGKRLVSNLIDLDLNADIFEGINLD